MFSYVGVSILVNSRNETDTRLPLQIFIYNSGDQIQIGRDPALNSQSDASLHPHSEWANQRAAYFQTVILWIVPIINTILNITTTTIYYCNTYIRILSEYMCRLFCLEK